ncbi:MAG: hypothetical protein KDL10_02425 [Kiritimatiellae bacterium]|nr:hypothetical protein [Kiritimatiellia bacterium]
MATENPLRPGKKHTQNPSFFFMKIEEVYGYRMLCGTQKGDSRFRIAKSRRLASVRAMAAALHRSPDDATSLVDRKEDPLGRSLL